ILILGAVLLNLIPLSTLLSHRRRALQTNLPGNDNREGPKAYGHALNSGEMSYGTLKEPASTFESKPSLLKTGAELLRSPVFYVLFVTWLAMYLNQDMILTTVVDFAEDNGVSESNAAALLSYFSVTDVLGRLLLPLIADKRLVRRCTLSAVNFLVVGLLVAALASANSYAMLLL
ncbi:unnamed protein product, partial [Ixodes hexagonus]